MKLSDFDYTLPKELIANAPTTHREDSKLMIVSSDKNEVEHKKFNDILDYFSKGDVIVLNETKVEPIKLIGHKKSGGMAEILVVKKLESNIYECKIKSKLIRVGSEFKFDREIEAKVLHITDDGVYTVEFNTDKLDSLILEIGEMPLPPYINSKLSSLEIKKRYQTVYAKNRGSVAAPTAGFHFSTSLIEALEAKGVKFARVTLHVGYGTFIQVITENIKEHKMHAESYEISDSAASIINDRTGRLIVVGTTSLRAIESACDNLGIVSAGSGCTDIYIYPGYEFKLDVDMMITNFHLPKSTLIMLVSAFIGYDKIMSAYKIAIDEKYRFYSFGDAMLLIR